MPEASVKTSKMSNEMQEFALSTANDAIKNQWNEQEVASTIKRVFESKYGKTWHCIVGRNFSTHVTHEEGAYIYFYIGQTGIMLFATA